VSSVLIECLSEKVRYIRVLSLETVDIVTYTQTVILLVLLLVIQNKLKLQNS